MTKPILFLVFNRLDYTKQSFEQIKLAKPPRFYIASDGAREDKEGEAVQVQEVRDFILQNITWDCEVKTLFRDENLGCGKAISSAVTWFFENEKDGIILEDDCVPNPSFFTFCEELLDRYKDDKRVWHIAGDATYEDFNAKESYYFAKIQHCWGWASWADRWQHYKFDLDDYDEKYIENLSTREEVRAYFLDILQRMKRHEIDAWDYQWTFWINAHKGYCINPYQNLVCNIGDFGVHYQATGNPDLNRKTYGIDKIIHPKEVKFNEQAIDAIYFNRFGVKFNIPIFLASDENYAPYLCVAIYSILEHTKANVEFYILDNNIKEKSKMMINQSLKDFKDYSIEYIDMTKFDLSRFPNLKHYSLNTFSRYFIPQLKQNLGKILYLDVDIIAKSDIFELYNQDLQGFPLGAVLEDFYGLNGQYIQEHIDPNFKSGRKSFNAGVMIIDVGQFIKYNYAEILINKTIELADKLSCPDQDIFNIVFENNYKILDYKFNFMIDLYKQFENMYPKKAKETMKNHCIIHYVSYKPWQNRLSLGQADFERVADETLFAKQIQKSQNRKISILQKLTRKTSHNKLKLTLLERIFSIKNHPNQKHKVITLFGIRVKIKRRRKFY